MKKLSQQRQMSTKHEGAEAVSSIMANVFFPHQKSNNLHYDMQGCWVDCLINQAYDGPSIILID